MSRAPPVARDTRKDAYESTLRPLEVVQLPNTVLPARRAPRPFLNLEAITTHLTALADVQSCGRCDIALAQVITDTARLLAEVSRLYDELATTRLEAANLRAAIRATLSAAADGEPDPLAYLRWESADSQARLSGSNRGVRNAP